MDIAIKEIITEVYKDHEELNDLLDSIESDDFYNLAQSVCYDEYNNNVDLAKQLCLMQESTCDTVKGFQDLIAIVQNINGINDPTWAEQLYLKAMALAEQSSEYIEYLYTGDMVNNKILTKEAYQKFLKILEDDEAAPFYYYEDLGKSVNKYLDDQVWAKDIFIKGLERLPTSENYRIIAHEASYEYSEMYDIEWAKELLEKSYKLGDTSNDYWEIANMFVDKEIYDPANDDDDVQRNWLNDLYILALVLTDDDYDIKKIKSDMKERNSTLKAKFIKDRGAELLSMKNK